MIGIASLLFITAIWGWTFVLVKEGVAEIGPFWFLALRFSLASFLSIILFFRGLRQHKELAWGAGLGVVLFSGYFFQTWGLQYTTAQKSGLITGLSVVLVPVIARLFGLRTRAITWAGVGLASGGLVLLVLGGKDPLGPTGFGDFLTLICAASFALHLVLLSIFVKRGDFLALLIPQFAMVAVLSLLGVWIWEEPSFALSPRTWQAIAITGGLATTVAFYVLAWVQRRTAVSYTAIVLSMEPVFAGIFGWLLLGEALGPWQIVGAGLILFGIGLPQVVNKS